MRQINEMVDCETDKRWRDGRWDHQNIIKIIKIIIYNKNRRGKLRFLNKRYIAWEKNQIKNNYQMGILKYVKDEMMKMKRDDEKKRWWEKEMKKYIISHLISHQPCLPSLFHFLIFFSKIRMYKQIYFSNFNQSL